MQRDFGGDELVSGGARRGRERGLEPDSEPQPPAQRSVVQRINSVVQCAV